MRIYVHSEINIQGGVLWLRDCRKEACAAHKALAESFGRQQPRPCIISQLQEAVPSFRRLLSFRLLCRSCADTSLQSAHTSPCRSKNKTHTGDSQVASMALLQCPSEDSRRPHCTYRESDEALLGRCRRRRRAARQAGVRRTVTPTKCSPDSVQSLLSLQSQPSTALPHTSSPMNGKDG